MKQEARREEIEFLNEILKQDWMLEITLPLVIPLAFERTRTKELPPVLPILSSMMQGVPKDIPPVIRLEGALCLIQRFKCHQIAPREVYPEAKNIHLCVVSTLVSLLDLPRLQRLLGIPQTELHQRRMKVETHLNPTITRVLRLCRVRERLPKEVSRLRVAGNHPGVQAPASLLSTIETSPSTLSTSSYHID